MKEFEKLTLDSDTENGLTLYRYAILFKDGTSVASCYCFKELEEALSTALNVLIREKLIKDYE